MGYSIVDFVTKLKHLEMLLADDFQSLSGELKKKTSLPVDITLKYRVVKQLQYHDIMRQKIEHVRHFMEELAADAAKGNAGLEVCALPVELVELSLALLRYTLMEYADTTSDNSCLESSLFHQAILELIKDLELVYLEIDEEEQPKLEKEQAERLHKIAGSFSMKSERDIFSSLFNEGGGAEATDEESGDPEGQVELF